ncbi:MAG: type I methionyl aminopeptidase [Chloroflexi bacterium]|nr:type I methionyl aminopeptidase [Chloroflexota bacterium]
MKYKNNKAIARMRTAGRMVAECFQLLGENIQPGANLQVLDQLVEQYIADQGAEPLYQGYQGSQSDHPPFPGVICASVNNEICHGLPNNRFLKEGDIVAIDIGLRHKGYCGDACYTFSVGNIKPRAKRLLDITQECLRRGIEAAQPGNYLGDIGRAIHDYADTQGVSVVREWGGHGIGRSLHESPSVSHVRQPQRGPRLRPGMTFTIEPMINEGAHNWILLNDGWTVITADGKWSAQFEHTIVITKKGPEILTLP